MTSQGNQYSLQGRGAAEGKAGGPMMAPGKGPTDRRDIVIAAVVIVAVALAVILFVSLG